MLLITLAGPARTLADTSLRTKPEDTEARKKEKEAKRLFDVGKVDEAIEAYKTGYVIEPNARFLYNLATASELAARYDEALSWVTKLKNNYRDLDPESAEAVERLLVRIKKNKAVAEAKAATSPPKETDPSKTAEVGKPALPEPAIKQPQARPSTGTDWLGLGLVSIGSVASITGGLLLFSANDKRQAANKEGVSQTRRNELNDSADTRQTFGLVALGAGLAIGAAGIVKLAFLRDKETMISVIPTKDAGAFAAFSGYW